MLSVSETQRNVCPCGSAPSVSNFREGRSSTLITCLSLGTTGVSGYLGSSPSLWLVCRISSHPQRYSGKSHFYLPVMITRSPAVIILMTLVGNMAQGSLATGASDMPLRPSLTHFFNKYLLRVSRMPVGVLGTGDRVADKSVSSQLWEGLHSREGHSGPRGKLAPCIGNGWHVWRGHQRGSRWQLEKVPLRGEKRSKKNTRWEENGMPQILGCGWNHGHGVKLE